MKIIRFALVAACWSGLLAALPAANWYVATNGTGDGTNWANATNSLQGAINASIAGDTVWVSNGVYQTGGVTNYPADTLLTNRVAIYKAITLRSANNDPTNTIIKGAGPNGPAAVRCVYMTNGSTLIGFTLTNGATLTTGTNDQYGGGVWSQSTNTVISNCTLSGNSASYGGGGAYGGTLYNCTLAGNSAFIGGGAFGGTLYNSTLSGNSASYNGGGAYYGTLYNCTLSGNSAPTNGGGAYGGTLYSCTIVGNSALGGGVFGSTQFNCISWGNNNVDVPGTFNYSCGGGYTNGGSGNITNDPLFIANGSGYGTNHVAGNYRLQSSSPCINTGTNQIWMTNTFDLDGNPRIIGGLVDMGAYEYTGSTNPVLAVSPVAFTNAITQGQNCPSNTFEVWNSGGGTLNYWLATNAGWLSAAPGSGTSTGEHDTITISYQTAALPAAGYTGQVTVASTAGTNTVSVLLTVSATNAVLAVSPLAFTNAIAQGQNCPSNTFEVWNAGSGTITYSNADNSAWLSVTPDWGTSTGEHDTITINYQTAGLGVGVYTGLVTVQSVSTSAVTVWLIVTAQSLSQGWTNLGSGMNAYVQALASDTNGNLFAGGGFTNAGGVAANRIAKWNGTSWTNLAAGISGIEVHALAFGTNGNLYAGGNFSTAGDVAANYVAKWDGTSWTNLGNGMNNWVYALACAPNGDLYAGGYFTNDGDVAANYVAKWDGISWTNLGSGMNDVVYALACDTNGQLYAGGWFTTAGGVAANYIAKWDGTSWTNLGSGVNNPVRALASDTSGNLFAGGTFANYVAKWDGTSWANLGSGVNYYVHSLACDTNGNLYAGGWFTTAGGVAANRIAKWNGTSWTNLGNGMNSGVEALASDVSGQLYAGGYFTNAGGVAANRIAKWGSNTGSTNPVLAVSPLAFTNAITQGENCPSNTFEVWNSGAGTLDYALATNAGWLSAAPVSGTSTGEHDTILITYQTAALSAGGYTGQVTVASAVATSTVTVWLTVTAQSPSITAQPQSLTNNPGQSATFSVMASGTAPLFYQWQKWGTNLAGATTTNYIIGSVQESDEGNYRCVVSNVAGMATSAWAYLTVNDPPAVPTSLSASDGTYTNNVALGWNAAAGAMGYQVWRHTVNNSSGANLIGTATSAAYDDTGAVAGTTYYYWVKATNAYGASAFSASDSGWRRAIYMITATAGANGGITPSGAVPVLQGASQMFTILPEAGYHIGSVIVDGAAAGTVATYTFTDVSANHTIAASFTANQSPVIALAVNPTDGMAPLRVRFDFTGSADPDGSVVKFEVDRTGDGIFEVQSTDTGNFIVEYSEAGAYQTIARITDNDNATAATSVVVTVRGVSPVADIAAYPESGNAPLTVTFQGTNSSAPMGRTLVAYEWDFNGDGVYDRLSRTGAVSWTYREAGANLAALRVTDNKGVQATDTVLVRVSPPTTPPPVVSLTATPLAGYLPLEVTFTATIADGRPVTNYYWDFDGDSHYDKRTSVGVVSNVYTVAGTYQARVLAIDASGLAGTNSVNIQVSEANTLSVWLSTPRDGNRVSGSSVSLMGHAAPASQLRSAQFQVKPAASNTWENLGVAIIPPPYAYSLAWDVSGLELGDYDLRLSAVDSDGNTVVADAVRVTLVSGSEHQPGDVHEDVQDGQYQKTETFSADETATLRVFDGTVVIVLMETVGSNLTVLVALTGANTNPVNGAAFGRVNINANRQISIEGNPELQQPVVIIIPYNDDNNDGVIDGTQVRVDSLVMYWYDPTAGEWQRCLTTEVHPDEKYVQGTTYHLTEFGLFGSIKDLPIFGDFDGDRKTDPAVYEQASGTWRVLLSGSEYREVQLTLGGPGSAPVPADYDADQKADPGVYQESRGYWYGYLSSRDYSRLDSTYLGGTGYAFEPADYDGDGKADPAVYSESTGQWAAQLSGSDYTIASGLFGGIGQMPVPADYDGDGKADPALYGETSGTWYFLLSGYEYTLASVVLGGSGYVAIPADYDGDAKTDPAVYEQASGQWYILHSNNNYSPVIITLGGSGYWPVPGEYDGAGAVAPAVYQESSGTWRILLPSLDYNEVSTVFGGDSFAPVIMCR